MRSVNFFIIDRCRVTFRDKGVETCLSRSSADGKSVSPPGTTGAHRGTTKAPRLRRKSEAAKAVEKRQEDFISRLEELRGDIAEEVDFAKWRHELADDSDRRSGKEGGGTAPFE